MGPALIGEVILWQTGKVSWTFTLSYRSAQRYRLTTLV